MKRVSRMLGVTLLEIMLVLAIAAMVIVMSIRYYQSASISQKINAALNSVTAIAAAGENYLNANGKFTGISMTAIQTYLPAGSTTASPWGGQMVVGEGTDTTYKITITNAPDAACTQIDSLLKDNPKFESTCPAITVKAY